MTTWLIEDARVVADPLAGCYDPNQSVVVEGECILEVGEPSILRDKFPQAYSINACGAFLLPGLIDAHTHFYSALTYGMPLLGEAPQNFPGVLSEVWWKFDKALTNTDSYLSALVGGVLSIRAGITTIFDHHASPNAIPDSLDALTQAIDQCGLRACLSYEATDRDGSERFKVGVAENIRFIQEVNAKHSNLLKGLFGMHAVFSLSDESIHYCVEQMAGLDAGYHIHMAEHQTEVARFSKSHSQTIPEFLNECGVLGPKTITAHTVHITKAGIDLLKKTSTFNVHNPRSNIGNGVGIAPVAMMFEQGQSVGLGSDGFYDLPLEIALTKSLQILRSGNPSGFSDRQALEMVYAHNAHFAEKVFGCKLGKIAAGYQADLLWIDYDPPTPIESHNLTNHIVAALQSSGIHRVWIGGQEVFDGGNVRGLDEEKIWVEARLAAKTIWARRS